MKHVAGEQDTSGKSGKSLSIWGRLLPDCVTALDLAKTGTERPLKLRESLSLRYNSVLCLYCQCSRERFDRSLEAMRQAQHFKVKMKNAK